ncbi:MAG: hypothetical protein JNM83_25895 [Myxococcales bacterium]|jgi:hypothetical protein|nr:hypothetical protein [Myxococcales bacterium]
MRLRNFLCTLAVLFSLVGQGSLIAPRDAAADLIINRPFSGKRAIELNIHGSAYYDSGLGGGRPCYNWNNGNGNNFCGYFYGNYAVGPGISMLFPVLHNGFVPSINNAVYVGFFIDTMFHPSYYGWNSYWFFSLPIGPMMQWRFYLIEMISVYANLGFGIWPWFADNAYGGFWLRGFPLFQLGANFHFTQKVGMNIQFGYPSSQLGLNISF